jgi:hypothetical protein
MRNIGVVLAERVRKLNRDVAQLTTALAQANRAPRPDEVSAGT